MANLTDAQVSTLNAVSSASQGVVQGRRAVNVSFAALEDRCLGHQILTAIEGMTVARRLAEFGANAPATPLQNIANARWYLEKITSLTFRASGGADLSWKSSTEAGATPVTMPLNSQVVDVNEPFSEWWRAYFGATIGGAVVTLHIG